MKIGFPLALILLNIFNFQDSLAKDSTASTSHQTLYEIESGRHEFSNSKLYKICNELIDSFEQKGDMCALSATYSQLSTYYYRKGDYAKLAKTAIAAEVIYQKSNCDSVVFFKSQLPKTLLHFTQKEYSTSNSLARNALNFLLKEKKEIPLIISYYSFFVKSDLGQKEKLFFLQKANNLAFKHNLTYLKAKTLNNLGYYYFTASSIDSAKYYFNCALNLSKGSFPEITANLFSNLSGLSSSPQQQLAYMDSAYQEAYKSNNLDMMQTISQNKALILRNINENAEAYDALWLAMYLKDSLMNIQKLEAIAEMNSKYESEKKEEQIKALNLEAELNASKNKRNQFILFGSGAFILLIAASLYGRLYLTRKSKKALQKEKTKSDNLLLNILPAQVAEELKETGESQAQQFNQVSILFTDFKEFTQTAEKLSAKELVNEINTCFKAFDNICEKYGIEKIKTIGDSYMAASGLGQSSENQVASRESVRNLVLAALEMQEFITLNFKQGTLNFTMRAGIHTGPVVAGIVGDTKFQYDIWGDTVNTASRMESHGEVGKVNISEATYKLLNGIDEFLFQEREAIEVKGKGEMKMWYVSYSIQNKELLGNTKTT
ncbi:MAG: adenylate/guanylate cyclase domain-containing protein [Bacteroidia bacterium]